MFERLIKHRFHGELKWFRVIAHKRCALHLIGFVALLSGCTLGPQFQRPEIKLSENWIAQADIRLDALESSGSNWWLQFNDPVLNQLIQLAQSNNLDLQAAAVRIQEARAGLSQARGSRLPQQQSVSGEVVSVGLSENAANQAGADQSFGQAGIGFDTVWELDVWGRFSRGVEIADADYLAAVSGYDQGTVMVVAEVARVYTLLRSFEKRRAIAIGNVNTQLESLRIAQVRFDNGAVTELDVSQAKALLHDTEAIIPVLEAAIHEVRHALSVLIGRTPTLLFELVSNTADIPTSEQPIAVGTPVDLLRRRPDVRLAEYRAAAQSARIGLAISDLYPRFSLLGSIGLQTSSNGGIASNNARFGDLIDHDSVRYTVGPIFSWPIFNYGRIRNNVRVQDAKFQQAALNYHQTVLKAAQEVEDALTHYEHQRRRLNFLELSVAAAEQSMSLALIQYRQGSVNYQRVLDTQRFLFRQQDLATTARGEVTLNLIATYKALGGDWSPAKILDETVEESMRGRVNWGDTLNSKYPETEEVQ